MSVITRTAAKVSCINLASGAVVHKGIAGESIEAGQPVYQAASTGKMALASGDNQNEAQASGIVLDGGHAGGGVAVCSQGDLTGWDLSGLDYDDSVWLSDTDGELDTAAGTVAVRVGRVVAMTDSPNMTKVLRVFFNPAGYFS